MTCSAIWPTVAFREKRRTRCSAISVFALATLAISPIPAQAETPLRDNMVALGVCPPWNAQSVEVCKHSVKTVTKAFADRLNMPVENTRTLINEGASADGLKLMVMELANALGSEDRLIIYANLPSKNILVSENSDATRQVLQLWADEEPETADVAIEQGVWISAPAFAAMLHTIPAGEIVLMLDTSNSDTVDPDLLASHATNEDDRPEALVTSAGAGQMANYSADRTIALFAKHLSAALETTEGTLLDIVHAAAAGTRQAAIPICAGLKENMPDDPDADKDCTQIPEIHDPAGILSAAPVPPLESGTEG